MKVEMKVGSENMKQKWGMKAENRNGNQKVEMEFGSGKLEVEAYGESGSRK